MRIDCANATRARTLALAVCTLVLVLSGLPASHAEESVPTDAGAKAKGDDADRYLTAVKVFADTALTHAADKYGDNKTPLWADGLHVEKLEPVKWKRQGTVRIVSNFASQQNFLRTLVALSTLTGDEKYRDRAKEATQYAFDHVVSPSGLIYWGGHCMYDLDSDRPIMGKQVDGQTYSHELSAQYPFYEFLAEVDRDATIRLVEAIWAAHIHDWRHLGMDRHGDFHRKQKAWVGDFRQQKPFFMSRGLASVPISSDLMHAGIHHHKISGDEESLVWTRRLADYFVLIRHPKTGLGAYRYTQESSIVHEKDPATGKVISKRVSTDKFHLLFGDKYSGALQGTVLHGLRIPTRFAKMPMIHMEIAELLGDEGDWYLKTAIEDMVAFQKQMYDSKTNTCQPMLHDGTKLDDERFTTDLTKEQLAKVRRFYPRFNRKMFYLKKDLVPQKAEGEFVFAAAKAYRLSGDERMWDLMASVAKGNGLPELHRDEELRNPQTDCSDPLCLFGVLELYRCEKRADLLQLAKNIGDNILKDRIVDGFFLPSKQHIYARIDAPEPLALLHLVAAIEGKPEAVPTYLMGRGYYRAAFDGMVDARGRTAETYDIYDIYPQTKVGNADSESAPDSAEE